MVALPIIKELRLTAFEIEILRLAVEEAGLDPDDEADVGHVLSEAARRFVERSGRGEGGGSLHLPAVEEKFDELVVLCMAHGLDHASDQGR